MGENVILGKGKKPTRKKRGVSIDLQTFEKLPEGLLPAYVIVAASLKDDFCKYTYRVTEGIGKNDQHTVEGSNQVLKDLTKCFEKLHVHLAVIDDVFKHSGREIEDIDTLHNDELTGLYYVNGIVIKGEGDSERVQLIGNKYVSAAGSGRIDMKSPYVSMGELSSYTWYNELRDAVMAVRKEVALYKEGKYVHSAEEENPQQLTISAMISKDVDDDGEGADTSESSASNDDKMDMMRAFLNNSTPPTPF